MPRKGRKPGDRKGEDFEWRKRDEEYRALARELHKEWCARLDDDGDLIGDSDQSDSTDE